MFLVFVQSTRRLPPEVKTRDGRWSKGPPTATPRSRRWGKTCQVCRRRHQQGLTSPPRHQEPVSQLPSFMRLKLSPPWSLRFHGKTRPKLWALGRRLRPRLATTITITRWWQRWRQSPVTFTPYFPAPIPSPMPRLTVTVLPHLLPAWFAEIGSAV